MQIEIAERLRPYTHSPGTSLILPLSTCRLQIFPARLNVESSFGQVACLNFHLHGPVEEFTILQDLEKKCVQVWGRAKEGYFRYRLEVIDSQIALIIEKVPSEGMLCAFEGEKRLFSGDRLFLGPEKGAIDLAKVCDRLSLGSHKSLDWDLVRRRGDFAAILPVWHRLGQLIPFPEYTAELPEVFKAALAQPPEHVLSYIKRVYSTAFESLLSPRLADTDFQGLAISLKELRSSADVLTFGAHMVRALFAQVSAGQIDLLPLLPSQFHCGRFLDIDCGVGILSMEWSKKMLRRFTLTANTSRSAAFIFHREERSCRMRVSSKEKGVPYLNGTAIDLVAGQNYWFDNFVR